MRECESGRLIKEKCIEEGVGALVILFIQEGSGGSALKLVISKLGVWEFPSLTSTIWIKGNCNDCLFYPKSLSFFFSCASLAFISSLVSKALGLKES